jgi:hypothetical protein
MAGQTREFLAERDLRIFKMRQAGVASNEIARRFGISTGAVNSAIRRQLEKLNREALMAYPEVLRLELERLDTLQQAIWPLTQHRKVVLDDGTEVTLEPDLKAVQQVLSVMDRRSRLLGMEQTNVNVMVESGEPAQRAVLAGSAQTAVDVNAFTPEAEARQLLEVMAAAGVLPEETIRELLGTNLKELESPEIIDAEIVEP